MRSLYFSIVFLVLGLLANASSAAPKDASDFWQTSGLLDIPDGSYLEGSYRQGGIQPDYHIDYGHPEIQRLIRYSRKSAREEPNFWRRIERIIYYIRTYHLKGFDYNDQNYIDLNKRYLQKGMNVPLGAYSACRAGVCRENALLLHIALKEAGIKNHHGYAKIRRSIENRSSIVVEDHAFVVVKHRGDLWVADSYYDGFNGYLLKDLMSKDGITATSVKAPIAYPIDEFRRILEINKFPTVYLPKKAGPPNTLQLRDYFKPPKNAACSYYFKTLPAD